MICKFCSAQIAEDCDVCPECGKDLVQEEVTTELLAENIVMENEAAAVQHSTPKRKVRLGLIGHIGAAIAGLGLLGFVLLIAMGVLPAKKEKAPETVEPVGISENSAYCVEDEEAAKRANDVVATMGDAKLTNAQLQIYYRMQVLDFVNYYGSYLSAVGLDLTMPLSDQPCYYDETLSWEQYFVDAAIKAWEDYQSIVLEAEANGFQLDPAFEEEFAGIPDMLKSYADEGGYESVEVFLKELLGPGCTAEDYVEYVRLNTIGNEYYASEYEKMTPSDEKVENYFTEIEAELAQSGITKDSGLVSSVRHILVCPKAEETPEETGAASTEPTQAANDGSFTEEQWQACYAEAERILEEWKSGAATEESFAELVPTYSEDGGSLTTGGLYENIDPTSSYVENFLNWAVDMSRQPGDTGIVQTEYGYHIMYFVSGKPYWKEVVRAQLISQRAEEFVNRVREDHPAEVDYDKIALAQLNLA